MSRRTPLWLWTATLAALAPLTVFGLLLVVADTTSRLSEPTLVGLASGAAVSTVAVGAVVGLLGQRVGRAIDAVRNQALALPDPALGGLGPAGTHELVSLSRAVATLRQRVALADEVAERARRTSDETGAGVFRLLGGLVAAEEGARGQLAAELHDTVAQSLLAARQLLAAGRTDGAEDQVSEAEDQVRGLMARTRPPELRNGDLAQAVADLRGDLGRRYGLRVHIDWPAAPRPLPLASAVVTYRFFQEALLNVVKHADVDDAQISLDFTETGLLARVCDAGGGFQPAAVAGTAGRQVGLSLLRERARLAGGGVTIASSPGAGTQVQLVLPLAARLSPLTGRITAV